MPRIIDRLGFALAGALGIALVAVLAGLVDAGPLDPPGTPAPTDSVRLPGTPISSLPFSISQSGNYYLTRNLTGTAGITVGADDVTLDLNGFELNGAGSAAGVHGISTSTVRRNIAIRNGTVRDWGGSGISMVGSTDNVAIDDIFSSFNDQDGIAVSGPGSVSNSVAFANGVSGIAVFGGVEVFHCRAQSNGGNEFQSSGQSYLHHNIAIGGSSVGTGAGIFVVNSGSRIEDNMVQLNAKGIDVDSSGNLVVRNQARGNTIEYEAVAGNIVGTIVTTATTDPWANFDQ